MVSRFQSLFFQLHYRFFADDGQDLVEYALVVAMISLACVAGMRTVASDISTTFSNLGTTFNGNI